MDIMVTVTDEEAYAAGERRAAAWIDSGKINHRLFARDTRLGNAENAGFDDTVLGFFRNGPNTIETLKDRLDAIDSGKAVRDRGLVVFGFVG